MVKALLFSNRSVSLTLSRVFLPTVSQGQGQEKSIHYSYLPSLKLQSLFSPFLTRTAHLTKKLRHNRPPFLQVLFGFYIKDRLVSNKSQQIRDFFALWDIGTIHRSPLVKRCSLARLHPFCQYSQKCCLFSFFPLLPHLTALSPFQPQCISEVALSNAVNFCLRSRQFLGKTYDDLSVRLCCKLEALLYLAAGEEDGCEEGGAACCPRLVCAGGNDPGAGCAQTAARHSRLLQSCGGPVTQSSCARCPCAL